MSTPTNQCPNCGYCPTCKRDDAPLPAPVPASLGYVCSRCGLWVSSFSNHACWGNWSITNGTTVTLWPANLTSA